MEIDETDSFNNEKGLFSSISVFLLQFISQSWNQAGESPSHLAVLIQAYLERNTVFLWILVATTYAISGHYLSSGLGQYEARIYSVFRLLLQGLALAAFLFKFYSTLTITSQLVAFAPLWVYKSSHYIDIITLYRVLGAGLISGIAFVLYRAKRGFRREGMSLILASNSMNLLLII